MAPPKTGERVKSPDCRRMQKAGSSTDENNLSKSSSANSLNDSTVVSSEGVTHLHFADAFTTKNDFNLSASLHVGTTLGSVISIIVSLPESGESRASEPVVVSPSGSLFRQRGKVLAMCFLDASAGCLLARGRPAENVKVPAKSGPGHSSPAASSSMSSGLTAQDSQDKSSPPPAAAAGAATGDQEVMVVCTEKFATVYALPSQRQMYSQSIDESSNVVRASVINFGGSKHTPALVCFTACGFVKVFSLPSLRPLFETYFVSR